MCQTHPDLHWQVRRNTSRSHYASDRRGGYDREFQTLALRAVTAQTARVDWHLDGRPLGSAPSDAPLMWPLLIGTHHILARDPQGHTAEATITVR
jgi:hypothetical protein